MDAEFCVLNEFKPLRRDFSSSYGNLSSAFMRRIEFNQLVLLILLVFSHSRKEQATPIQSLVLNWTGTCQLISQAHHTEMSVLTSSALNVHIDFDTSSCRISISLTPKAYFHLSCESRYKVV